MATEFKLSYTGSEVNQKLGKIDGLVEAEERLTNDIAVERARINTFTNLGEGSTTGDAELMDIRVGYDGTVYETAGEAVREQIKQVKSIAESMSDAATPIYNTAYGNPLMVSDGTGRAVKELKATLQNAAGFDSVNISITGKNLFDKSKYINGTIGQPNMYSFYPVSTYGESRVVYVPIVDGETYTITQAVFGNKARYAVTDAIVKDVYSNNVPVFQPPHPSNAAEITGYVTMSASKNFHTFVNKFNHKYLVAEIFNKDDTLTYDEIADSIQLELGATATALEAYNGAEYAISIGETVTGGTLDVTNGVFTKSDGTEISVTPTAVVFPEGNISVSITNATEVYAKYVIDTKTYIDKKTSQSPGQGEGSGQSGYAPAIYKTAYGCPLMISDACESKAKELTVSLANDASFNSVTVRVSGKNLFDRTRYSNAVPGNPNMTFMLPVVTYGDYRLIYIPIADGETYTITHSVLGKYARWCLVDEILEAYGTVPCYQPPLATNTSEIAGFITMTAAKTTHTFVNKYNRKYLTATVYCKEDTITYDEIADSIQVELGTTATAVENYHGSEYTVSIGETVTGGTLDVINGVFTKADGSTLSVEGQGVAFGDGYNVVTADNATNISAMYIVDTKTYIDLNSGGGENPLAGKKIVAIGDSMVYGHTIAADKTWLALIAERNGMTFVNYGSNGRYMTHNPRGTDNRYDGVCDVFQNMDNDADYVLVFAGTNDIQQNFTIGDEDSTDSSEFFGALNAITDGLQAKYPTAKIAFITPYARAGLKERCKKFRDAICVACERGGIPVFDNIKNGGINWDVAAQLTAYTLNDTYHLNEQGMDMASRKYEKFLKQI
jgi:lysophospholipase L1-like esterase